MAHVYTGTIKAASIVQGGGSSNLPSPTLQVEAHLDSTCYALDTLESIVGAMLRRLQPVMADIPVDPMLGECSDNCLVPIASRISSVERRIRTASADLEMALNAMQI